MWLHTSERRSLFPLPLHLGGPANSMSNTVWQKGCSGAQALRSLIEFDRPLRALSHCNKFSYHEALKPHGDGREGGD